MPCRLHFGTKDRYKEKPGGGGGGAGSPDEASTEQYHQWEKVPHIWRASLLSGLAAHDCSNDPVCRKERHKLDDFGPQDPCFADSKASSLFPPQSEIRYNSGVGVKWSKFCMLQMWTLSQLMCALQLCLSLTHPFLFLLVCAPVLLIAAFSRWIFPHHCISDRKAASFNGSRILPLKCDHLLSHTLCFINSEYKHDGLKETVMNSEIYMLEDWLLEISHARAD